MFVSLELLLLYEAAVVGVQHRKDLLHIIRRLGLQTHHLEKLLMVKGVSNCTHTHTHIHTNAEMFQYSFNLKGITQMILLDTKDSGHDIPHTHTQVRTPKQNQSVEACNETFLKVTLVACPVLILVMRPKGKRIN